jgi:hypothetical protein
MTAFACTRSLIASSMTTTSSRWASHVVEGVAAVGGEVGLRHVVEAIEADGHVAPARRAH